MKKIVLIILIITVAVALLYTYSNFIEPKFLVTQNIQLDFLKKQDLKIVIFSDLHLGKFKNGVSLKKVVEKVNSLNPDLVFIVGDFVFKIKDFKQLKYLSNIKADVYAVLGNHDVGFPGEDVEEEVKSALALNNVFVLDNAIEKIGEWGITLVGLSDLYQGKTNFNLLKQLPKNDFVITLVHNPDAVYSFPEDTNVDLVVAGHTHGGQVRIPFLYKKFIPTKFNFDKGVYKINDIPVIITSGVGMSGLPFRFLMPPEIVILKIY